MKTLTVPSHVEITVRRPDGQVETVQVPNSREWSQRDFAGCKQATANAGRGEVLSYRNVTEQVEQPTEYAALDKAERNYDDHVRSVYRAMDADYEGPAADRTPAHPSDL